MSSSRLRSSAGALVFFGLASAAIGHPLDTARARWDAGRYRDAFLAVQEVRDSRQRESSEGLYIQGTSACRLPGVRENGRQLLDWLLSKKRLALEAKAAVREEIRRCGSMAAPHPRQLAEATPASISISGKTYFYFNDTAAPMVHPAERSTASEEGALQRRRPRGDNARLLAQELLPSCGLAQTKHLTLCSTSGHSSEDLQRVAAQLEKHIGWLSAAFGFRAPDTTIYVYLLPNAGDLVRFASTAHELELPYGTVGYTNPLERSVAAVASGFAIGSALHEITHILFAEAFPDAPQWLEEGVASLYESSLACGDVTLGNVNWRSQVLDQPWAKSLTIRDVVNASWFDYQSEGYMDDSARRAAEYFSLARYLMLELQQTGRLREVIAGVRDTELKAFKEAADIGAPVGGDRKTATIRFMEVLERAAGMDNAAMTAAVRRRARSKSLDAVPPWAIKVGKESGLAVCEGVRDALPVVKALEVERDA